MVGPVIIIKYQLAQSSHDCRGMGGPLGPPFLCNHVFRCQNLHHNTPKMALKGGPKTPYSSAGAKIQIADHGQILQNPPHNFRFYKTENAAKYM